MIENTPEQQIENLCNLVPDSRPAILTLQTLYILQQNINKEFAEKIKDITKNLRFNIVMSLEDVVFNKSKEDSDVLGTITFHSDGFGSPTGLIPFIVHSSFSVDYNNEKNQLILLTEKGYTPIIKLEKVLNRTSIKSYEEIEVFYSRISSYLKEFVLINTAWNPNKDEFRIYYDLSSYLGKKN